MQFAVDAARDRTVGPTLDAGDQAIDGRASATDATTSPPRVDAGTPIAILFGGALNDDEQRLAYYHKVIETAERRAVCGVC